MGGGDKSETFITEAKATMHHTFCTRRMLAPGESAADYVECTQAQRTAYEQAEAEWSRPPQLFIDQWTEACGIWGGWNEETGYFELNGLLDITYPQAIEIWNLGPIDRFDLSGRFRCIDDCKARTNLPRRIASQYEYTVQGFIITNCFNLRNLEVLNLCMSTCSEKNDWAVNRFFIDQRRFTSGWIADYGMDMPKCKRIIGIVDLRIAGMENMILFSRTSLTVGAKFANVCQNIRFACKVDIDYLIENASNTKGITVTFNSRGAITDEQIAAAAEKNIRFSFLT